MKLREFREQKGVTQKAVAAAIGCTATVYSRYERGEREPDIATLCTLADYFEVSTDVLIGYIRKCPKDQQLRAIHESPYNKEHSRLT